ncbi:alpha/beta hydrolase family protein [Engelhardtia mirabilis]|uniref:Esterase n=1 Tax=Engelhardtia mirabilis TaxID=2528011 RepID=A0A518BFE1_9BACT|nr:esterase [Planctomycetes bacterium Pla133]QDV00026.1 esterase [Planctomycetes bacterium Pla86]
MTGLPDIRNGQGELLAATFVPAGIGTSNGDGPIVVIGHGLTSDRTRPWSAALSAALAELGLASVRVAFSGNGDSEGSFLDSTPTKEVGDLGAVLDVLEGRRLAYVGHSMGALVGCLRAVRDRRIEALVSLAGMVHSARFYRSLFAGLEPGELLLGKPGKPLGEALRDDLLAIDSVLPLARDVRVPWLLVHGDADEVVPVQDSRDVAAELGPRTRLVELPGVDHSFTGAGTEAMVREVAPWLARALR